MLPQVIAHRGGREWAPENTMAAFRRSLDAGVHGIELDVQRCATGELVVFHDEDLSRTTNGIGLVKDCSLAELQRLDAGSWYDKQFAAERIPLLSEVLSLIDGKCVLNVELKNAPIAYPDIEEDLLEAISQYPHRDKLIISSFDHKLMIKLHEREPLIQKALLADAVLADLGATAGRMGATFYHPSFDCTREDVVAEAHDFNLRVNVWTVNERHKWRFAVRSGVDGIITDDPAGLQNYLAQSQAISARNS